MSRRLVISVAASLVLTLAGLLWWIMETPTTPRATPPDLTGLLGNGSGFARVSGPWEFRFPADHGPHPDFHTENWYFTGHLQATDGQPFAFQLLLTRVGLKPGRPERASNWASHRVWRGQLVVADLAGGRVHAFERFSRDALGLAGASNNPVRVWLEDWRVTGDEEGRLHLKAAQGPAGLKLTLTPAKPLALAAGPVGPFYGYAASRLSVAGTLALEGQERPVTGLAWLDRAWGALPLGGGAVTRDRLLLQLSDGRELTVSRLQRRDGSRPPVDTGALIETDGAITPLGRDEVQLTVTGQWQGEGGVRYPDGWQLRLPDRAVELTIEPELANQELDLSLRFWSGALRAEGRGPDGPLTGRGHGELTGHGD